MSFNGWPDNATGEDVVAMLKKYGGYDMIQHPNPNGDRFFKWYSAVDKDIDILNVLCIMLWYNDRSVKSIDSIRAEVATLLTIHRRRA